MNFEELKVGDKFFIGSKHFGNLKGPLLKVEKFYLNNSLTFFNVIEIDTGNPLKIYAHEVVDLVEVKHKKFTFADVDGNTLFSIPHDKNVYLKFGNCNCNGAYNSVNLSNGVPCWFHGGCEVTENLKYDVRVIE